MFKFFVKAKYVIGMNINTLIKKCLKYFFSFIDLKKTITLELLINIGTLPHAKDCNVLLSSFSSLILNK